MTFHRHDELISFLKELLTGYDSFVDHIKQGSRQKDDVLIVIIIVIFLYTVYKRQELTVSLSHLFTNHGVR